MKTWLHDLWQAALLKRETFERLQVDRDAFLRGFLVIVAIALVVGLPTAIADSVDRLQPGREAVAVQTAVKASLVELQPLLERAGMPDAMITRFTQLSVENAALAEQLRQQIQAMPTWLPRSLAQGAMVLGGWLSRPFSAAPLPLTAAVLATWLGYGVWVMLFARLLGGRATLQGFFGATALFAVPHVLGVFALVPVAGPILGFIGFIWGLVIYVKATAVSHDFSTERGLLATLLPFLLLLAFLLTLLALATLVALIAVQ